jgi:hypothetical protein
VSQAAQSSTSLEVGEAGPTTLLLERFHVPRGTCHPPSSSIEIEEGRKGGVPARQKILAFLGFKHKPGTRGRLSRPNKLLKSLISPLRERETEQGVSSCQKILALLWLIKSWLFCVLITEASICVIMSQFWLISLQVQLNLNSRPRLVLE